MDGQPQTNEREQLAAAPMRPRPSVAPVGAPRRSRLPGSAWLWWLVRSWPSWPSSRSSLRRCSRTVRRDWRNRRTPRRRPRPLPSTTLTSRRWPWRARQTCGPSGRGARATMGHRSTTAPSQCQTCLLILRYDGHAWSRVPLDPALATLPLRITSVAMLSATEGWAVGGTWFCTTPAAHGPSPRRSLKMRRPMIRSPASRWSRQPRAGRSASSPIRLPAIPRSCCITCAARGPQRIWPSSISRGWTWSRSRILPTGEGWIVGGEYTDAGQRTVVLHLRAGVWASEETGAPAQLNGVYAVSRAEAWAVGTKDIAVGPASSCTISTAVGPLFRAEPPICCTRSSCARRPRVGRC